MEKVKNSHQVGLCENFAYGGEVMRISHLHYSHGGMRNFRICTIHTPTWYFEAPSNCGNFWLLRVGNVG